MYQVANCLLVVLVVNVVFLHQLGSPNPFGSVYTQVSHNSMHPNIKPVQDANGKQDGTSQQEAPQALCKTGKNVREPSNHAKESN